jgi:DNA-binding CsgD family transcriptional regulator
VADAEKDESQKGSPVEISAAGLHLLSDRERQVLGMAASGFLDKQIGQELGISLNTLRTYWSRIRSKVGEAPRAALAAVYMASEVQPDPHPDFGPVDHEGWVLDVKSMMMLACDSINDLHGLEHGVPHPATAYSTLYHPEDKLATRARLYDVIEGRIDSSHLTFRMVNANGVHLINLALRTIRDKNGEVAKVIGQRVRTLDCRPGRDPKVRTGSWTRDLPSNEYWADDDLKEIMQIGPDDDVFTAFKARIKPDLVDRNYNVIPNAIARGETTAFHEGELYLPDGSVIWARANIHIVDLGEGRYRAIATVATFH